MTTTDRERLDYVALGDSYTIGTSVDPSSTWPAQLVEVLDRGAGSGTRLRLVANLGVNGYTSGELIRDELPELGRLRPEFASLQIGVNDVVRGIGAASYEANLGTIFEALLAYLPADRIVTVGIPDYTVTPRGAAFGDPRQQSDEIARFNTIMAGAAADRGIRNIETFDLSRRADIALVAERLRDVVVRP